MERLYSSLSSFSPLIAILVAASLLVILILRRSLLSPLRDIPGPWYAAVSGIWLWISDIQGSAPAKTKDLHTRHGQIVRIGPNEVSIDDVEVHNSVLYCQAPKFMKASYFYDPFKNGPTGSFQTSDPKEHAILRRLISRPFSKKSIFEFEPQIQSSVNELTSAVMQKAVTGSSFDLSKMSRCLSLDFISKFVYGDSLEAVKVPDFAEPILDAFDQFVASNFLFMMMPSLRIPSIVLLSLLPFKVFQAISQIRVRVKRAVEAHANAQKSNDEPSTFKPLLQAEVDASVAQNYPLTRDFLISDGVNDIFAGTDTTSTTLTLTLLEVFSNVELYDKLHQELVKAMPNSTETASLSELEALPYLSACVKQTTNSPMASRNHTIGRPPLQHPNPLPSPTDLPPSGWTYKNHFLPAGTIVSSSAYLLHYNETIFPSAHKFQPERWLSDDREHLRRLESAYAPFSKGSRGCVGINLALAEIYITVAVMVRRFRLVERFVGDVKTRDIFGVVFDGPVTVTLEAVRD